MILNLSDSELKALVKTNINSLIGVSEDRLKVTFTKRSTQIDTSVEILKEGEAKSITDPATPVVTQEIQEEAQESNQEPEQTYVISSLK